MISKILVVFILFFSFPAFSEPTTLVYNLTREETILETVDASEQKSIASITKLMTALVVVDSGLDLFEKIPYPTPSSSKKAARIDLLYLLLIRSDNYAANSLAEGGGGVPWFVYQMNRKAEELNLTNTRFQDPSGLGVGNKSTALDLKNLLNYAFNYDIIKNISSRESLWVINNTKDNKSSKEVVVNNTNKVLLQEFHNIKLSKTGTTNAAGKCLVMVVVTERYEKVAIVILGAKNRDQVNKLARMIINRL